MSSSSSMSPCCNISSLKLIAPSTSVPHKASNAQLLQANDLPFPRSGHRIVANDEYLYCIGGYNPELWVQDQGPDTYYPIFKELWKFNILTKKWSRMTANGKMPVELASHAATLHGSYLVVVGGTGVPFGHSSSNDIHICDLRTLYWRKLSVGGRVPQKQYGHGIARSGEDLYVVGGTTGFTYNMEVHHISLRGPDFLWDNLSSGPEPIPRYRHEVVYYDKKLYILGGGTSDIVCPLTTLDVFDICQRKWESYHTRPDRKYGYPRPRRCHSVVTKDSHVLLIGGYDGRRVFNDMWQLDLTIGDWVKLRSRMPQGAFFHDATLTPSGRLFVVGGVTHINNLTRSNNIYQCWIQPPPLRIAAAEVLLAKFPQLRALSASSLGKLGIPKDTLGWIKDMGC